jgi:hypothetical protein
LPFMVLRSRWKIVEIPLASVILSTLKQTVARQQLHLGLLHYSRQDLERVRASGEMLSIQVLGLATIAADVSPELARETISSIQVLGALHASRPSRPRLPIAPTDRRSLLNAALQSASRPVDGRSVSFSNTKEFAW